MTEQLTIQKIKKSHERIKPYIKKTPIEYSYNISSIIGANIYLKLDNFQNCKAFKFRGTLSKITTLPKGSKIIYASAGKHSQGSVYLQRYVILNV